MKHCGRDEMQRCAVKHSGLSEASRQTRSVAQCYEARSPLKHVGQEEALLRTEVLRTANNSEQTTAIA